MKSLLSLSTLQWFGQASARCACAKLLPYLCPATQYVQLHTARHANPQPCTAIVVSLFQDIYCLEMELYSTAPALKMTDGRPCGRWFEARTVALRNLSISEFGLAPGTLTGEPAQLFRLMERPPHSNFAECSICAVNTKGRMKCITDRLPRAHRDLWVARQTQHVSEVYAERAVLAKAKREATRKGTCIAMLHVCCAAVHARHA